MKRDLFLALCASLTAVGCGGEPEEPAESAEPILGVMEMPISFRFEPSEPANAVRIEASPSRLRLDGTTILEWERGRVPEASEDGLGIRELSAAIAAAPARRTAALSLHANLPYATMARIMGSLAAADVHEAAFAVRQGTTTTPGWLGIGRFEVREQSTEPHEWPATHMRGWPLMGEKWQEMYDACRENHYVDCAYKARNVAEGGLMHITLFARGNAVKVDLLRLGEPVPEEATPRGPALIDGIEPEPIAQDPNDAPPATAAAFTWRFQASVEEDSPLSKTMRPICGIEPCGVLLEAEGQTQSMRIESFIGSAFPNGTPAPHVMFQVPPR